MILLIGGTGTTGRLVAAELSRLGHPHRVAGRSAAADVRFDWYDPASHAPVLAGVDAVYLIAPVTVSDPAPTMLPFLDRARAAGVRRAVLLSASPIPPGDHGLGLVHRRVAELFPQWTVLRPSWFMENFVGAHPHADSVRVRGEILSATGDGRVGFVDPADIAAVAARALTDPVPHNVDHVLTGPEALSYTEVAAILTEFVGRRVSHRGISEAELAAHLADSGIPADFAGLLAGLDTAIAAGAEDRTTSVVEAVTGRPPRSFREFCTARLTRRAAVPG